MHSNMRKSSQMASTALTGFAILGWLLLAIGFVVAATGWGGQLLCRLLVW